MNWLTTALKIKQLDTSKNRLVFDFEVFFGLPRFILVDFMYY
jgi:hypothetical protein